VKDKDGQHGDNSQPVSIVLSLFHGFASFDVFIFSGLFSLLDI
jgi:hypothetical protein